MAEKPAKVSEGVTICFHARDCAGPDNCTCEPTEYRPGDPDEYDARGPPVFDPKGIRGSDELRVTLFAEEPEDTE